MGRVVGGRRWVLVPDGGDLCRASVPKKGAHRGGGAEAGPFRFPCSVVMVASEPVPGDRASSFYICLIIFLFESVSMISTTTLLMHICVLWYVFACRSLAMLLTLTKASSITTPGDEHDLLEKRTHSV